MPAMEHEREPDLYTTLGRRQAARERAGCRAIKLCRETGTPVGLYHAGEAGIESDPEALADAPWVTVCEAHHTLLAHSTERLARGWMPEPSAWCEDCRAIALERAREPRTADRPTTTGNPRA